MAPLVSVILPVYNCESFIHETVESILNQTYIDFELLIIDDASSDETVMKIKQFEDDRIKLIEKPENTGYTNSLNQGIKLAKGKYIARMDSDDICEPNRFEKQVKMLENRPELIVCGSAIQINGGDQVLKYPLSHTETTIYAQNGP